MNHTDIVFTAKQGATKGTLSIGGLLCSDGDTVYLQIANGASEPLMVDEGMIELSIDRSLAGESFHVSAMPFMEGNDMTHLAVGDVPNPTVIRGAGMSYSGGR